MSPVKLSPGTPVSRTETRSFRPVVGPLIEGLGQCGGNANRTPNNQLGDGVDENDRPFKVNFPYVAPPNQGYAHTGHE